MGTPLLENTAPNILLLFQEKIFESSCVVFTYAEVPTEGQVDYGGISPDGCATTVSQPKRQCQMSWCAPDCQQKLRGAGQCVNEICMCTFCFFPHVASQKKDGIA